VLHQIVTKNIIGGLPTIDSSLIVLMVVSQGGYVGNKLVTFGAPTLLEVSPRSGPPGTSVVLSGANLGSQSDGQLLLNSSPIYTTSWSNTSVQFTVATADPNGNAWTVPNQVVQLAVSTLGQRSNFVLFTITVLPAAVRGCPGSTSAKAMHP